MRRFLFITLCLFSFYSLSASFTKGQPPAEGERKAGDRMVVKIKDVEYPFRWCPPGTFVMGSPVGEASRNNNERQHEVTLTRGFWLLETEVTQLMWESVMGNNPSRFKGEKRPVEQVTWHDSQEYVEKLNTLLADTSGVPAGFKVSLPTEAQWEYACRSGTATTYYFGDTLSKEQANFAGSVGQTTDVGSYPANAWGLRDMHGNVWEWCLDWWGDYPENAVTDPTGVSQGTDRVDRGGSWYNDAWASRSALRGNFDPAETNALLGLRIALVSGKDEKP